MQLDIRYNSQRDNYEWGGKLRNWAQCWYTSSIMFLSAFLDLSRWMDFEREYIDETETKVGKPGKAEKIAARIPWLKKLIDKGTRSGAFYIIHKEAIKEYLEREHYTGSIHCDRPGSWLSVTESLENGWPVILSTKLTNSGHIILIVGETATDWILHDPYGNAHASHDHNPLNGYRIDKDGGFVHYPKGWLQYYAGKLVTGSPDKCFIIYYKES